MSRQISHDINAARRRGGESTKAHGAKKMDSYLRKVNIREEIEREEREKKCRRW